MEKRKAAQKRERGLSHHLDGGRSLVGINNPNGRTSKRGSEANGISVSWTPSPPYLWFKPFCLSMRAAAICQDMDTEHTNAVESFRAALVVELRLLLLAVAVSKPMFLVSKLATPCSITSGGVLTYGRR
ncbi:hypothetical protein OJAV_G00195250 [Oryzias javanicus]|uniref:Uncharacterized protein n=1 Tax=Oryzias javanicus TaxID=123683 RepID=A0A437CBH6_ORYJA|nr:hypothetical protein OJAV_G00195250 [Oryzias javanicus]